MNTSFVNIVNSYSKFAALGGTKENDKILLNHVHQKSTGNQMDTAAEGEGFFKFPKTPHMAGSSVVDDDETVGDGQVFPPPLVPLKRIRSQTF